MTGGELAPIVAAAASCGLTLSELVRRRVLGRRLPRAVPPVNREAWSRLGPLAANLNQYVRAIHQGQAAGAPLGLLEALRHEIAALRLALVDDPEDQRGAGRRCPSSSTGPGVGLPRVPSTTSSPPRSNPS
jgi:hypothetical protein